MFWIWSQSNPTTHFGQFSKLALPPSAFQDWDQKIAIPSHWKKKWRREFFSQRPGAETWTWWQWKSDISRSAGCYKKTHFQNCHELASNGQLPATTSIIGSQWQFWKCVFFGHPICWNAHWLGIITGIYLTWLHVNDKVSHVVYRRMTNIRRGPTKKLWCW